MSHTNTTSCVYQVPMIKQDSDNTCWYAAARMVIEYWRNKKQQSTKAGGALGQPAVNQRVATNDTPIPWSGVEGFARQFGFGVRYMCPTAPGLVRLLRERGPLWYGGDWIRKSTPEQPVASGHVVVIRGCLSIGNLGTIYFNDPWPGNDNGEIAYDQFFRTLTQQDNVPFLYLNA